MPQDAPSFGAGLPESASVFRAGLRSFSEHFASGIRVMFRGALLYQWEVALRQPVSGRTFEFRNALLILANANWAGSGMLSPAGGREVRSTSRTR